MLPDSFSVTITQDHIDKAVASGGKDLCRSCIVWQAVNDKMPNESIIVGITRIVVNWDWLYAATLDTVEVMGEYTTVKISEWTHAQPGKTINFVVT